MELNKKKLITLYLIICLGLILVSCSAILFKEWILPICVLICSIFGFINLLLLMKTHETISPESGKGAFVIYMLFRYLAMAAGLVISCLLIRYTMGEEINKSRYLLAIVAAIPYIAVAVPWMIVKS